MQRHLNTTLLTTCQLTDCGDIFSFPTACNSELKFLSDSATMRAAFKTKWWTRESKRTIITFLLHTLNNKTDYRAVLYSERRRNNITLKCKSGRRNGKVSVCTWSWTVTDWTRGGDGKFRTMIAKLGLSLRGGGRKTRAGGRGEDGAGRSGTGRDGWFGGNPSWS